MKALASRAGRTKDVAPSEPSNEDDVGNDAVSSSTSHPGEGVGSSKKTVSFRNYAPQDKSLEHPADADHDEENDMLSSTGIQPGPSKRQRVTEETTGRTPSQSEPTSPSSVLQHALVKARQEIMNNGGKGSTNSKVNDATMAISATTNVTSMAPKKVNWDLKRDIANKLAKLERRTQKAIVEMLKERLELEAAKEVNSDDDSDLD